MSKILSQMVEIHAELLSTADHLAVTATTIDSTRKCRRSTIRYAMDLYRRFVFGISPGWLASLMRCQRERRTNEIWHLLDRSGKNPGIMGFVYIGPGPVRSSLPQAWGSYPLLILP